MKKLWSVLAAMAMLLAVLTGCGKTGSDWESVQKAGVLKIGITLYEPMNYKDENGKLIGFDTELAEAVCAKLGVTPEFVEIDWEQKVVELKSGNIDCVWNGMTVTDDLAQNMDFSNSYSGNMQVCVINKANESTYTSLADMAGAKIVAEAGSAGAKAVEANKELAGASLTTLSAQRDTLLELKSGTADVAVIDGVMANASVGEGTDFADLMIVPGIELTKEEYAVGLRKGSDLTEKINTAFTELMQDGTVAEISEKYSSVLVTLGE